MGKLLEFNTTHLRKEFLVVENVSLCPQAVMLEANILLPAVIHIHILVVKQANKISTVGIQGEVLIWRCNSGPLSLGPSSNKHTDIKFVPYLAYQYPLSLPKVCDRTL